MARNISGSLLVLLSMGLLSCGGFDGAIREDERNIIIDVDNTLFDTQDAANIWEQGPGLTSVVLSLTVDDVAVEETLDTADSTYNYTQVTIPVTGILSKIEVKALRDSTIVYSSEITDKRDTDSFEGWETFANVMRFKMEFHGTSTDWDAGYLSMDVSPRGGTNVTCLADSGVTAAADAVTDWGTPALATKQIAIEPVLHENPTGLTFDLYILIVDEDLKTNYKQGYIETSADYEYNPWEDVWTYDELTTSGKLIAGTTYILEKENITTLNFINPSNNVGEYNSYMVDLSADSDAVPGKFLLYGLVIYYGNLLTTSSMGIVEIK